MNIPKRIVDYLNNNGWSLVYNSSGLNHFKKIKDDTVHHLYITYYKISNEYEVELGFGEDQNNSKIYKLRNILSILKKQGL